MHPLLSSLCLTLMGAGLVTAAPQRAERPNIIVVITDDQGYGDLGRHGNPVLKTPHLDRLHDESIRLTDFHVSPMCTPSRSQLLTGRDALVNGAMNVSSGRTLLRRGLPTMADLFAAGGYRTGQFGKWHLGDNYPYRPQDRGFQRSLWFPSSHIPSAPDRWENDYFDPWFRDEAGNTRRYPGYCTDVIFDEALTWIREQGRRREPFFAYVATNAPHGPLWVDSRYREPYRNQPRNVASFLGMVANIDENMGKLDRVLTESGLRDNTLLVFLTDNGGTAGVPVFNAGMRGRKIQLYEGGHRVPCFIRWPSGKLRPAGAVSAMTQCQDLLPTLTDLCDLRKPRDTRFDGISLAPLLRGKKDRLPDRKLVIQFSRMNAPVPRKGDACVLWRRWRLVSDRELYDLSRDPAQQRNVITEHPEVAKKLRTHYEKWWAGVEPEMNEPSRIVLGAAAENPTLLSPADWYDVFLDQARQVRIGEPKNGAWYVDVARAGEYEISLRRYPVEADLPLTAAAPPFKGKDGELPGGKPLPIEGARVQVGSLTVNMSAAPGATAVNCKATLPAGPTRLQTWFLDRQGKEISGAYYVYVRRL